MSKPTRKLIVYIVVIELYFLLPLLVCGLSWYEAARALRKNEVSKASIYTKLADPFFQLTNQSYKIARPALWILQISKYTDHVMKVATYANHTALLGTETAVRIDRAFPLILKKDKSADEQRDLNDSMKYLRQNTPGLTNNLFFLTMETQNPQLRELYKFMKFFDRLIAVSDSVGGNKKEGKFLILFLNDKELRPGGGFIGSYGVATFAHYSLTSMEVHDVYDADGQLKEHVDPPPAVRDYLHNPHLFLRDSNYSPDFKDDAVRAQWFLDRELGAQNFDGVAGVTTTTIQNIIGAYGSITIPDSNITITKDNFYEKTQQQAQENFFPGSRQKQSVLSSLAQSMLLNFNKVSHQKLGKILTGMLTEKQIVLFMKDDAVQQVLEEYDWAGRMQTTNGDYVFPIESNVGVNKSNLYVERNAKYEVRIMSNSTIKHIYTVKYSNNYSGPDPTSNMYKNYFQLYIPPKSKIDSVILDGQNVGYQVWQAGGKTVATIYLEIAPKTTRSLTIIYSTDDSASGSSAGSDRVYTLNFQKQIGVDKSPLKITIDLPKDASLLSKNFDAEIKDTQIVHDDILDRDKEYEMRFTAP